MGLSKWRTTSMTWCTRSQWTTWFKACRVIAIGKEARYDTWLSGLRDFSAMQMKETRLFLWGLEGAWFHFIGHDRRIGKCYFVGSVNYRKKSDLAASWWRVGLFIIIPFDSLYLPRCSPGSVCTPWLYASHAARHAEGRGYGREDRDGGLNDEAPQLSFLFIHDFSFV